MWPMWHGVRLERKLTLNAVVFMTLTKRKGNLRGREFPLDTWWWCMRGNHRGSAMGRAPPSNNWSWHYQPHRSRRPSVRPTITTAILGLIFPDGSSRTTIEESLLNFPRLTHQFSLWFQVLRKAPGPSLSGKYQRYTLGIAGSGGGLLHLTTRITIHAYFLFRFSSP